MDTASDGAVVFFLDQSGSISHAQQQVALDFILKERTERYADQTAILCPIEYQMRDQKVLNLDVATVNQLREKGLQREGAGGTELWSSIRDGLKLSSISAHAVSHVVVVTDGLDMTPKLDQFSLQGKPPVFVYAMIPDEDLKLAQHGFCDRLDHGTAGVINPDSGLDMFKIKAPDATGAHRRPRP